VTDSNNPNDPYADLPDLNPESPHTVPVPPGWEGMRPVDPIDSLPALLRWLETQFIVLEKLARFSPEIKLAVPGQAARNAHRLLVWLGIVGYQPLHRDGYTISTELEEVRRVYVYASGVEWQTTSEKPAKSPES